MGDMGDLFNELKAEGQKKRASNRASSPRRLEEAGITFETKNGDAHLIVTGPDGLIDFWPGTGRWIARCGARGFGVRKLIDYCGRG